MSTLYGVLVAVVGFVVLTLLLGLAGAVGPAELLLTSLVAAAAGWWAARQRRRGRTGG